MTDEHKVATCKELAERPSILRLEKKTEDALKTLVPVLAQMAEEQWAGFLESCKEYGLDLSNDEIEEMLDKLLNF